MTEFLVNRSYADKYNLIACAIGHHIYESRWLRNPEYLNQIIHTWYRGNEGGPMAKMTKFSSWNADAVLGRYMVDGNKEFLLDMVKDLEAEYALGKDKPPAQWTLLAGRCAGWYGRIHQRRPS